MKAIAKTMSKSLSAVALALFACLGTLVCHAQAASYQVDGFTVTTLPEPTLPQLPVGVAVFRSVLYLTGSNGNTGDTPYSGPNAQHEAFLSVQNNAMAQFTFAGTPSTLYILWGTIGFHDSITFYSGTNAASSVVGVINGTDLGAVLGVDTNNYISIASTVPFKSAVLTVTSDCCFEFSDLAAK